MTVLKDILSTGRRVEVGAAINFSALTQDSLYMDIFNVSRGTIDTPQLNMLYRHRRWFGYDTCILDEEIEARIADQYRILTRHDHLHTVFDAPFQMPEIEMEAKLDQEIIPDLIQLNFDDPYETNDMIRMMVPFERLQRFLLKVNGLLERKGIGQIHDIHITHAPRLDNDIPGRALEQIMPTYQ